MNILQINELDQQRAEEILTECEIDLQDISDYMEANNLLTLNVDIIGIIYEYILKEASQEYWNETQEIIEDNEIFVYSNYLDTNFSQTEGTEEEIKKAIEEGRFNLENSSKIFQFFYNEIKN